MGSKEIEWVENGANSARGSLRCGEKVVFSCPIFVMVEILKSLKGFGRLLHRSKAWRVVGDFNSQKSGRQEKLDVRV